MSDALMPKFIFKTFSLSGSQIRRRLAIPLWAALEVKRWGTSEAKRRRAFLRWQKIAPRRNVTLTSSTEGREIRLPNPTEESDGQMMLLQMNQFAGPNDFVVRSHPSILRFHRPRLFQWASSSHRNGSFLLEEQLAFKRCILSSEKSNEV